MGHKPSLNGQHITRRGVHWRDHITTHRPFKEISKTKKTMFFIGDCIAGVICLGGIIGGIQTITDIVIVGIGVAYAAIRVVFLGLMKWEVYQIKRLERKKLERELNL